MEVFDTYEGNVDDEAVAARAAVADPASVTVDDDQRRRSRFRATTDAGTEVGVVLARTLRAGDLLSTGDADGPLLRVALEPIEALVVDLADADGDLTTAVALGHAAGNRHWDMAVRDEQVLFPATESDERMAATVEPHLPAGATLDRESVSPGLFDDGPGHGPDGQVHDHGHDGHAHDHGHSHDHAQDGAHEHAQDGAHDHGHAHDREASGRSHEHNDAEDVAGEDR